MGQHRQNCATKLIGLLLQNMVEILLATLALGLFLATINIMSLDYEQPFEQFKRAYHKNYGIYEQAFRRHIFLRNAKIIEQHNRKPIKSYTMEVNKFADLTLEQFKQSYLGLQVSKKHQKGTVFDEISTDYEVEIDWKQKGKVTRVKDQKMCASCWAFCSIAALQSAYLIQTGATDISFSEQQLVDCSTKYGNKGCHGGELWYTFQYLQDKGVNTESTYPYTGKDQNCKKATGPYKMQSYGSDITCGGLYRALLKGPVAVAVDALAWAYYKEGIFADCGNEVTHGVLVVGATKDYWLIKNSWGVEWGDNGYIKLKRGNTCSICEYPYFPIL